MAYTQAEPMEFPDTPDEWNEPDKRGEKREYDERGNPIPTPLDKCDFCGARRFERPEGFCPEIMTPFGEAEYLCRRCRENGRGMK